MVSPRFRALSAAFAATLALSLAAFGHAASRPAEAPRVGVSSAVSAVTVYGASWCGACRSLEAKLAQRNIPFEKIDVDRNRDAYDRARAASGMGSGIPLTNIVRDTVTWVQGDDADAVERAYKGQ
jgi:glutaredoxin